MRNKKYLYDFVIQILLIFVVTYLFKTNPNKIQASFWAGALFVLMPISMMMREWMFSRFTNRVWWFSVLQFWLLFAIPIFALRIIYSHTSLSEVSVGPIPAELWHHISSYSYLFLMAVTLWSWWKTRSVTPTN
jgi:hypothetical protein